MKSRLVHWLGAYCVLIIGLSVAPTCPSFAQLASAVRSKVANADALLEKARRPEGVRVIVTLRGSTPTPESRTVPSSSLSKGSIEERSGPLADGQAATVEQLELLNKHMASDAGKRQRWSARLVRNTPYLAITVNSAELEALAADNLVVSIHEEGEMVPGLQNSVPLIGIPAAYEFDYNARGWPWSVAVLDTGVDYNHPFLTNKISGAACYSTRQAGMPGAPDVFSSLCPNGANTQFGGNAAINCTLTFCEHGTHVAGIAAGSQAAGVPLHGVARFASIYAVQVFRRVGTTTNISAGDGDILSALADILEQVRAGARIASVNISIWDRNDGGHFAGTCDADPRGAPFVNIINQLDAVGVATVIISGNGSRTDRVSWPGCVGNAITVSSADNAGVVAGDANVSATVDLFAPGVNINSSIPGGGFSQMSGTSMAAPHVAGAYAAIRSSCAFVRSQDIRGELVASGPAIVDGRPACAAGAGCGVVRPAGSVTRFRLQVDTALRNLRQRFPKECVHIPSMQIPQLLLMRN